MSVSNGKARHRSAISSELEIDTENATDSPFLRDGRVPHYAELAAGLGITPQPRVVQEALEPSNALTPISSTSGSASAASGALRLDSLRSDASSSAEAVVARALACSARWPLCMRARERFQFDSTSSREWPMQRQMVETLVAPKTVRSAAQHRVEDLSDFPLIAAGSPHGSWSCQKRREIGDGADDALGREPESLRRLGHAALDPDGPEPGGSCAGDVPGVRRNEPQLGGTNTEPLGREAVDLR